MYNRETNTQLQVEGKHVAAINKHIIVTREISQEAYHMVKLGGWVQKHSSQMKISSSPTSPITQVK